MGTHQLSSTRREEETTKAWSATSEGLEGVLWFSFRCSAGRSIVTSSGSDKGDRVCRSGDGRECRHAVVIAAGRFCWHSSRSFAGARRRRMDNSVVVDMEIKCRKEAVHTEGTSLLLRDRETLDTDSAEETDLEADESGDSEEDVRTMEDGGVVDWRGDEEAAAADLARGHCHVVDAKSDKSLSETLALTSISATAMEANGVVPAVSKCEEEEERRKSWGEYEVDTRPICAVSMLISRFEHLARCNAEEAASARTHSLRAACDSSVLPSPPWTWSCRSASWTAAHVKEQSDESLEADTIEEREGMEGLVEGEDTKVDEAPALEKVKEEALADEEHMVTSERGEDTIMNESEEGARDEEVGVVAIVDGGGGGGIPETTFVPEVSFGEPAAKELTLEAEDVTNTSEATEEASVAFEAEALGPESVDDSADVVMQDDTTEATAAVKVKTVRFAEENAVKKQDTVIVSEAIEEPQIVVEMTDEVAEADVETCMTKEITTVNGATDASTLSVARQEDEAVRDDSVKAVHEVDEDAAPAVVLLIERIEAAVADFCTDEIVDASLSMKDQVEEQSSDSASVVKEVLPIYEELEPLQIESECQQNKSNMMERRIPEVIHEAPSTPTKDTAVASEATAKGIVETSALASHLKKSVAGDMPEVEKTPEREFSRTIPYEHMTYEILGVTRANKVMMYHVYAIDRATGERVLSIPKRFSEFNQLHEQLKVMKVPSASNLPKLPKPSVRSFLRGRRSKKTIEIREKAFGDFLHYIRDHEDLHESVAFQRFIAK
uniref:PX domain-containing protein n=1 Tax=Hyaloperonospora arabidopsidis (strain Emoy2) TaxID=559515 RepID=M4BEV2_HYAAE